MNSRLTPAWLSRLPIWMGSARWQREQEALLASGATLVRVDPLGPSDAWVESSEDDDAHGRADTALRADEPPTLGLALTLRWPLHHVDSDDEGPPGIELVVNFGPWYPWMLPDVRCVRRPSWLRRHINPVTGAMCLSGHGAPGGDGSWSSVDRDPAELIADFLSRQVPRIVESNLIGTRTESPSGSRQSVPGSAGQGSQDVLLEEPVPEGLHTWLRSMAPVLLLDYASCGLHATAAHKPRGNNAVRSEVPPVPAAEVVLVKQLSGAGGLHWLGLGSGRASEGTLQVPATFVEEFRLRRANGARLEREIRPADLLGLRMALLPIVALPRRLTPEDSDAAMLWELALRRGMIEGRRPVQDLTRTVESLLSGNDGCLQAMVVCVLDEVRYRQIGWTPLLVLRTRADRRRRWNPYLGTVMDASASALLARTPIFDAAAVRTAS